MSDFDQTVYSSKAPGAPGTPQPSSPPPPEPKKKNLFLIIGGTGCALLLCAVLVLGGGSYYLLNSGDNPLVAMLGSVEATPTEVVATPTVEPPTATAVPTTEPTTETSPDQTPTDTATVVPTEESAVISTEPEIGPITFALGATDDYQPISPAITFQQGITEIHAIFDYNGMSADKTWERVWYLDGEEILRNSAPWTDPAMGRFDYFLDAGGDPLPTGEWLLEIYVNDNLLAQDGFTIEADQATAAVAEVEPTPSITPTSSPTAEPSPTPGDTPEPTAASGGGTYQLVYTKWDGGQHNMYVADTNGNNEQLLLHRAAGPSWTPDGQQIFFFGEQGVDRQLLADGREFVFDGVSNGIVALVNAASRPAIEDARLFQGADWKQGRARSTNVSPNGQMVAFDADFSGNWRIYFLGTTDNQQFRFELIGEQPDWSPDSQKLVYRSGREGRTGLWISNRDDTGHILVTEGGSDSFPAWSPDGRKIAFSREVDGNVDIYTMNPDGSNVQRLTDAPGPDSLPVYTPSGGIVFRSARSGNWGIWKMNGDGTNQQVIIPDAGVGPDWAFSRMDVQ